MICVFVCVSSTPKGTHGHCHKTTDTTNPQREQAYENESKKKAILRACSLDTPLKLYNSRPKHDLKTKFTPIDFSHRGADGSRSSWLQTLGNQFIDRSPID